MKTHHSPDESGQSLDRNANRSATIHRLIKKGGLRARIDAKCCECIYDPHSGGTWRKQVENCTSRACPLYEVRPHAGYAS
jgi:hypothetical protein